MAELTAIAVKIKSESVLVNDLSPSPNNSLNTVNVCAKQGTVLRTHEIV